MALSHLKLYLASSTIKVSVKKTCNECLDYLNPVLPCYCQKSTDEVKSSFLTGHHQQILNISPTPLTLPFHFYNGSNMMLSFTLSSKYRNIEKTKETNKQTMNIEKQIKDEEKERIKKGEMRIGRKEGGKFFQLSLFGERGGVGATLFPGFLFYPPLEETLETRLGGRRGSGVDTGCTLGSWEKKIMHE